MNTDKLTSIFGFVAAVSGALSSCGVYPKVTGIVSAVSTASWAWFTNKRIPNYRG